MNILWQDLAARQGGLIARRQLRELGVDRHTVRARLCSGRWAARSPAVLSTFTGQLTFEQRAWLGVLHAGGTAIAGGLTTAKLAGLRRWDRTGVTILVGAKVVIDDLPGVQFVRTRRPIAQMRDPHSPLPAARLEPAVLLHAAYHEPLRGGVGLLAATVQQRLTSAQQLQRWLERMAPLRGLAEFRRALDDIGGGAQSAAELDITDLCRRFALPPPVRQNRRNDSRGIRRYTDAEWSLPDGHTLILEVDGSFHMDVEQWQDDIARERGLADLKRHVVRCTAFELRHSPHLVAFDLIRFLSPSRAPGS